MKVFAPAKINLGLEILDKRNDGYHNVNMVMQSVSLYDVLDVSVSKDGLSYIKSNINFDCPLEDNTMYKAAECFFEFLGMKNPGISIKIQKNIPSLAGLAGGSSDGAAVIIALDRMFETNLSTNDLMAIGAKVGSDVPFCILGGTAVAGGRGTVLKSINPNVKYNLVIIKPDINISTVGAYAKADNIKEKNILAIDKISVSLQNGNLSDVCSNLFNRFEGVIDSSEIFSLKEKLINSGALGALMTGSGSAVFGIFENYETAKKCHDTICKEYEQSFLCEPISHGAFIVD